MDKFIEKIKGIDKKILIGVAIALVVLIVAIVAVVIGSDDKPVSSSDGNEGTSSTDTFNADVNENEDNSTDEEESSSVEDESSTDEEESSSVEDESSSADDSQNVDNNTDGTTAVQQPTATNPSGDEILGAGSKNQPYLEFPDDNLSLTTVEIPAGKSVHYGIYRVGGMYFTINDANAYVICDGTKYTAKNGKVSFKIPSALASDAVYFEIGNTGSSAKSFTIKFANLKGTFANPEDLSKINSEIKVSLAAGNETGYYYEYNAEKTGTIRFYMTATKDSILTVTNNRNSAQRTTEADVLTDENGKEYIEIEVQKGDELIVNVGAIPNKRGKYPATEITWYGEYK